MSEATANEDWLSLIRAAATRYGGIKAVADVVGVSRTALSLALAGKYPGKTAKLEAKVLRRLTSVECPHLGTTIVFEQCAFHRTRSPPSSSPAKLNHWIACQSCPVGDRLQLPRSKFCPSEDAHAQR
jgi:hypothetical protein